MVTETREDIPLKKNVKKHGLNICGEEFLGGSKFINLSLTSITVSITIALFIQIYYGDYQVVPHGSVATDSKDCSLIGTETMKKGGNSVDAVIASVFCLCVVSPQSISLDGKGEVIIYNHREHNTPIVVTFNRNTANNGASVPNLVIGLAYLYLHFSKLPWKELISPSISLARNGFKVSNNLAISVRYLEAEKIFGILDENSILKLEVLSRTLKNISLLTNEEIRNILPYQIQPKVTAAINETFNYYNIFVPGGLSAGGVLLHTLKLFGKENFQDTNTSNSSEFIPKIAQIINNVYEELNVSQLFIEGSTTNVAAIDHNELYVSFVGGLSAPFGSRELSNGGFLKDVETESYPLSRFPVLILDKDFICGKRIIFGTNDFVVASQIVAHLILNSDNVTKSVEAPRFHIRPDHLLGLEDLHSVVFNYETQRNLDMLLGLKLFPLHKPYPSCNIIEMNGDSLSSHSDSRGGGLASRF